MNDESEHAPSTRYDRMSTFDKLYVYSCNTSLLGTPEEYTKSKDAMRDFVWQLILGLEEKAL